MPSLTSKPSGEQQNYDFLVSPDVPERVRLAKEKIFESSSSIFEKMNSIFFIISEGHLRELPHEIEHSLLVCNLVTRTERGYEINKVNGLTSPFSVSFTEVAYLASVFQPCLSSSEYRGLIDFDTSLNGDSFFLNKDEIDRLNLVAFMEVLGILKVEKISGIRKKCVFSEVGKQFLSEIRNYKGPETKAEIISEQSSVDEVVEVTQTLSQPVPKSKNKNLVIQFLLWGKNQVWDSFNASIKIVLISGFLLAFAMLFIFVIKPHIGQGQIDYWKPRVDAAYSFVARRLFP